MCGFYWGDLMILLLDSFLHIYREIGLVHLLLFLLYMSIWEVYLDWSIFTDYVIFEYYGCYGGDKRGKMAFKLHEMVFLMKNNWLLGK